MNENRNKRLELRVNNILLDKLERIMKNAAGIRSKSAAIEYAIDIALRHLDINHGEEISGHCRRAADKHPELKLF